MGTRPNQGLEPRGASDPPGRAYHSRMPSDDAPRRVAYTAAPDDTQASAAARPDDAPGRREPVGSDTRRVRPPRAARRRVVSSSDNDARETEAPVVDASSDETELADAPTARRRVRTKAPRPAPAPRAGVRRTRQTLVRVDLWSVTKLALCFYVSAMFVTLVALVALWVIADAAGVIGSVEKFLGDLLSAKDFTFLSAGVLRGAILVSLVIVALQVVITVIAASFYNIFAELFGGLELVIKEEDAGR